MPHPASETTATGTIRNFAKSLRMEFTPPLRRHACVCYTYKARKDFTQSLLSFVKKI